MNYSIIVVLLGYDGGLECSEKKKGCALTFTSAPITPREVRRRYSKGRVFDVVFKKGYRKRGMWALKVVRRSSGAQVKMDSPFKKS